MVGFMILVGTGPPVLLYFLVGYEIPDFLFLIAAIGVVSMFVSLIPLRMSQALAKEEKSVLNIAMVRREVSIGELSDETGLAHDKVKEILEWGIRTKRVSGYIENEAFHRDVQFAEEDHVHEPPKFCSDCGSKLSRENIEYSGSLLVTCPFCGASLPFRRRDL
ncbi:MAG: hypothetical protein RTU92_09730 [Candidatus Thorarchaeota archaeon]